LWLHPKTLSILFHRKLYAFQIPKQDDEHHHEGMDYYFSCNLICPYAAKVVSIQLELGKEPDH